MRVKPRVLMVTGAYFPESSGGGLQARAVVQALRTEAEFVVLTTSTDAALPAVATEDGVSIRRVYVDVGSARSRWSAALRIGAAFLRLAPRFDIVNVHGFSRKAILIECLSRLLGKRFVLTLQTGGQDEPAAAQAQGRAAEWAYRNADLYLSVSPGLSRAYLDAGLPETRLRQVCNAVDVDRFAAGAAGRACGDARGAGPAAGRAARALCRLLLPRQASGAAVSGVVARGAAAVGRRVRRRHASDLSGSRRRARRRDPAAGGRRRARGSAGLRGGDPLDRALLPRVGHLRADVDPRGVSDCTAGSDVDRPGVRGVAPARRDRRDDRRRRQRPARGAGR